LAQVFDALSFFADHQEDTQASIERNMIYESAIHPASRSNA